MNIIKKEIQKRVLEEAEYILKTEKTIRETAKEYGVSKSTVHKDISVRLKEININLFNKIQELMKHHIEIRHIRGGESTKKKYSKQKQRT